jgi:hypothetical protein
VSVRPREWIGPRADGDAPRVRHGTMDCKAPENDDSLGLWIGGAAVGRVSCALPALVLGTGDARRPSPSRLNLSAWNMMTRPGMVARH